MSFLEGELAELPGRLKDVPHTELVTCHPSMVQIKVRKTAHKMVAVYIQFPEGYPQENILLEIKSKTIPDKFLEGFVSVCDQEMKKYAGKKQALECTAFISNFISTNPFVVCSDELSYIKKELCRHGDELKVKQKSGVIQYRAQEGRYFLSFLLTVPNEYPVIPVQFELKDSNLPRDLLKTCVGHVKEIARQCVEPPARRRPTDPTFEPSPSLQLVADYAVKDSLRHYPLQLCPLCHTPALPADPKEVVTDESHPHFVYRVYCGHCFHQSCLETYSKTPPFTGGKKCPTCKERIFHDKWNVHPKLAEDRWAHQEARRREVAEVADFLGV